MKTVLPVVAFLLLVPCLLANIELTAECTATTFYECGVQIGAQMKKPIAESVAAYSDLIHWSATSGKDVFSELVKINGNAFPDVLDEYKGIAHGAGVDVKSVLVTALSTELSYFAGQEQGAVVRVPQAKSCSDFHVLHDGISRWGHNEDETADQAAVTYLVRGNVSGEVWIGFAYAPQVVGWAWGANMHGHGQSVNALMPLNVTMGLGTNFVARDVLRSTSLKDAVKRATVSGQGNGQHFNLGNFHTPHQQVMIETSPIGHDVRSSVAPVAYHANLYESARLKGIDGGPSRRVSSSHRMTRMAELAPRFGPSGHNASIYGTVLCDHEDAAWPIHRDGSGKDCCITLNSVVFDLAAKTIRVWGHRAQTQPVRVVDWATLAL